jgi:hypothetical protein
VSTGEHRRAQESTGEHRRAQELKITTSMNLK